VVDAIVMKLVANCMDRAKHRRRDAAAKTHMRLACFPEDAGPDGTKDFNLVGCSTMMPRFQRWSQAPRWLKILGAFCDA
jgi:hypothetical protein